MVWLKTRMTTAMLLREKSSVSISTATRLCKHSCHCKKKKTTTAKCLVEEKKKEKKIPNLIHEGSRLTSARSRIKSRFLFSFGSGGLNLRFSAFCSSEPKSSNAGLPGSPGLVMQLSSPSRRLFLPASDFLVLPRSGF